MSKYETRLEVAEHADCEGGLLDFVFGYGVRADDMPDEELATAIKELLAMAPLIERVEALLPEPWTGV